MPLGGCVERLTVVKPDDDVVMVYSPATASARSAVGAKKIRVGNNHAVADNRGISK